jgi:DNA-directed RNA polymerase subunit RPC12/RpoP
MAKWALPAMIILALAGIGLVLLGAASNREPGRFAFIALGALALALAGTLMVASAVARVRRDARKRELDKYACGSCGYAPAPEQIEDTPSLPCPRCGQSVYSGTK